MNFKKITNKALILILVSSLCACTFVSCNKKDNNTVVQPDGENKKEEIIINENYADSALISFEGTIDEIYDDGSMLIYSPFFSVNFNYKAIVEIDENTVFTDDFEPKVNQLIKYDVYSAVKKSEPLTVVASTLTLVNETSNQREEEEKRNAEIEKLAEQYINSNK